LKTRYLEFKLSDFDPETLKKLRKELRFFRDCDRKKWPLRGNPMAQWELRNIDNVLSMFRRKRLLDFGVFKEAGEQTLKAHVEETNIPKMQEVYDFILDRISEIVRTY
jgi:hypothetical protein